MGVTAIMTKTDRERISGEADVDDSKRYESASRVRQRIDELETDAEILKENHPNLYEELREAVCDE
ncbi:MULTISPECIES: hypothetical protein [Halobacterium]|uniref:Uncharacterized protein n=1 Tax=Halobacterium salinarum (strain ATCC 33171 / DSM 3754 / JCM 8978 / NBRC 102687 / NCIMB 764 / 91-R6) TaxID=2597657 RepID=A0A4D6GWG0_HALS9|nr:MULTISPECIES: hypothetical protein [Halobacterium]TYO74597.1 hypothetical protein APQ99_02298 [Halobacterium salinarum DSM 3754]MCF2166278.1 hypothetical protein [Halobacterium salinarum]MCF2168470.1 hypothetical protein [Halobacterium salinarum]MCF2207113.1 hypothetical protein [Halobacterium salinarum]MCF2240361.1 hypothetical protein [Halobacterium salinarum]